MSEQARQKIIPNDLGDCLKFIAEHRDDVARGSYDIQIEKDWVRELGEPDVLLLAQSCPGSRLTIASMTKSTGVLQFLSRDAAGDV